MTTEMQTPYELFAYQVGQYMKGLTDRVEKLEGTSVPTMTQTCPLAVVTVSIDPQDRAENTEKLGNGDYIRDESHISGTIQLDRKYTGFQFMMLGNDKVVSTGTVGTNGVVGFYSRETTYRQVSLFLFSPEQATSQIYFDAIENPKKKGVTFSSQPEISVDRNEQGRITVMPKGIGEDGKQAFRYLEYGKDKLKVTVYEKDSSGEHEFETMNTLNDSNSFEYNRFMTDEEVYEFSTTHIQGYDFGTFEQKILLEVETKEGYQLEKEVVNKAYQGDSGI